MHGHYAHIEVCKGTIDVWASVISNMMLFKTFIV